MPRRKSGASKPQSVEVPGLGALPVVYVDPSSLASPKQNPNRMPDAQFQLLIRAIRERGFLQPVLVREVAGGLEVIDGEHRKHAAIELELPEVPAINAGQVSDEDARLLQIAMNKLRGELDLTETARALAELADSGLGLDLELSGFTSQEIADLTDALAANSRDLGMGDDLGMGSDDGGDTDPRDDDRRDDPAGGYPVEVVVPTAEQARLCKRKLRDLGDGDAALGLLRALGVAC